MSPVENRPPLSPYPSLFGAASLEAPADLAQALAPPAAAEHFDELRGRVAEPAAPSPSQSQSTGPASGSSQSQSQSHTASGPTLAPAWDVFFQSLGTEGFGDLNHRNANLQRQIRDNGVTYNVYADADGPQRPWALDLFPMVLDAQDWASIQAGVSQRTRLLECIMADVYGPQTLMRQGLLPAALVQGHPGFLRPMLGVQPAGGTHLHIAAFDLARGPDGRWWVVSQRTQAPSGLGYLLENRLSIALQFPEAFSELKVQRLAASYKALVDGLKAACPASGDTPASERRIVLLTPGPYNETYFEHAYLARYLGLTLVEGSDLLVRQERLYLKTLQGLEPVHGLIKRLDDEFLDPLELRADSTLGVPGLLQVIRAGNVLVANAPGSAFLESPALLGFLPALSEHLLGEKLALPSLATWWCGEQAALQSVLPQLRDCVIKPTYPASRLPSVIGRSLGRDKLDEWSGRLLRHGVDYTVQAYLPLSQTPTWQGQKIAPRSAMVRVFALADGRQGRQGRQSWRVLPGGLARLAGKNENIASMQYGGSSADVWALGGLPEMPETNAAASTPEPAASHAQASSEARLRQQRVGHKPAVSSRSAENLFWLGRYTERAENSVRMAQLTLQGLSGEDQHTPRLLAWLSALAVDNALVLASVPPATQAQRVFERALIANLGNTTQAASVGYNLRAIKNAGAAVRERLSQAQWQVTVQAEADFFASCASFSSAPSKTQAGPDYSAIEALRTLDAASSALAAITGFQTDRMMRDDGWRLLSIGRHIERLSTLAAALASALQGGALQSEGGFAAVLSLFDSTITFQAQYQQRRDLPALLDLLVLDADNPRSLAWVVQTLRSRLSKLAGTLPGQPSELAQSLPDPAAWPLLALCQQSQTGPAESALNAPLVAELRTCAAAALSLSDAISQRYFSHAWSGSFSLGA